MAPHKVLCWHALGCTAATPTSAASSVQMCIPWQPSRRRDAPHKISRISSVLQFNGRRPAGPTLVPNDFDIEVVGLDHHDYAQNKMNAKAHYFGLCGFEHHNMIVAIKRANDGKKTE